MEKELLDQVLPDNERMKTMLEQLRNKAITIEDLNKECAYWLIHCDLRPLLLPTMPEELTRYYEFAPKERDAVRASFWYETDIRNYLNQRLYVISHNKGLYATLVEFESYVPTGDIVTKDKYRKLIIDFKYAIEQVEDKCLKDF